MEFQVKCQVCLKKIPIKSFKGVSKMFQGSFLLQFCSRMYLIAATRAEGGLVFQFLGGGTPLSLDLGVSNL